MKEGERGWEEEGKEGEALASFQHLILPRPAPISSRMKGERRRATDGRWIGGWVGRGGRGNMKTFHRILISIYAYTIYRFLLFEILSISMTNFPPLRRPSILLSSLLVWSLRIISVCRCRMRRQTYNCHLPSLPNIPTHMSGRPVTPVVSSCNTNLSLLDYDFSAISFIGISQ